METYQASDPEKATIRWTLHGNNASDFSISSSGILTFNEPPDFENSTGNYNVTVRASDGGKHDEVEVTVTVDNVDEPGEITISNLQPQEAQPVTATLTDPDGAISGELWQWARGTNSSGPWTNITDTDANYTPTKEDAGKWLRVTARYTDPDGAGKTAEKVSENAVRGIPYNNLDPDFQDAEGNPAETAERSIAENSKANTPVGDPVAATDIGENDRQEALAYTLSGSDDDAKFDIDRRTGQIKTKTTLNYDSDARTEDNCANQHKCVVTVKATDPSGETDTITVNISVTNVDEAPVFDGDPDTVGIQAPPTVLRVEENQPTIPDLNATDDQAPTYSAKDPENDDATVELTLAGTDADHFAIDATTGVLSFKVGQDYEAPGDSGGNRGVQRYGASNGRGAQHLFRERGSDFDQR